MGIAMVSLKRTKTGLWAARKGIPEALRASYGKREEKKTWPAELTAGQAKAELAAWLEPIESRLASLKAVSQAAPLHLTLRQCSALAGDWYRTKTESEEARFTDSGGAWDWDADIDAILPVGGEGEDGSPWLRPTPAIVAERDALLLEQSLRVDEVSADRLLQEMLARYLDFLRLMQRRIAGDFGADPVLATLPPVERVTAKTPQPVVTISALFEEFAKTGTATAHTVAKWRKAVESFVKHLGHDDAARVTRADAHSWFDALMASGLSLRTVRGTYRAALARVFKIAHDRGRLTDNPFTGVEVIGPKAVSVKRKEINDAEAKTILGAALAAQPSGLSATHALARRWVPWICAYTGARVNEITQLRAMDIRQEDGVWVFHITPEAGSVKTRKARSVPVHSALIEQGVLKLAKSEDASPLFYDPTGARKISEAHPLSTQVGSKLAKWVRALGVTEVESPNHGWRHRFKSLARLHGMNNEARDRMQGHAVKSEGEAYGSWPTVALNAELEKLPRYEI